MACLGRGSARASGALVALLGCAAASSCTTTQQAASRLQLNDARIRASQLHTRIIALSTSIEARSVLVIPTRGHRTFVVVLRNLSSTPTSDNAIVIGLIGRTGRATPLNGAANRPYFDAHLPSIPARGELRWVLTTSARVPPESRPYALVGRRSTPSPTVSAPMPSLSVSSLNSAKRSGTRRKLVVRVQNRSSIPQYQLPVYAIVSRSGVPVAAGAAVIPALGADSQAVVGIPMFGSATGGQLELEAPPTTYQ